MTDTKKITYKSPSTYVFIDSANIIFGAKATGKWKVDFLKLYKYLVYKYQAKKVFYYTGYKTNFPKDDMKLEDLTKIGYIVRAKPLKFIRQNPQSTRTTCPKCGFYWLNTFSKPSIAKANCDVDLTMDMMKEKDNFTQAIVMSGDGDFLVLYKYLELLGKNIGIISESKMTARLIRQHFKERFSDLLSIKKIIKQK